MKIVCESCGAKYSIADEKVAGKVFKIRCKKCSAVIVVKGDQPAEGENAGAFDYGSDAVWHVVVAGEQQGPFAPRQIGELLAEGKIDWEAYVWREGMDGWQPAKDVEDLVKSVMAEAEGGEAAKSEAEAPRGEVFGGSSDMGADPFASSTDDGGLSGVIGQGMAASATAAGGGADLFADSSRSAFAGAAASDDDEGSASGLGAGPRVSGDSAMTGQRNENSVLFSLSNLQALATGSGAAPASGRPKPGMAQGEGSGLIDIRALASATQSMSEKPAVGQREKIEDLLAVGSTGTTFSATSLAAPVATDRGDSSKVLLYGMAAAILLLGGVVAYLAVRPAPAPVALTPAPASEAEREAAEEENLKVPASAAAAAQKEEPAEAPQAEEPSVPADEPKDEHASAKTEKKPRHESSGSSSSTSATPSKPKEEKPAPVAAAEPKKPAQSSADKSLDDLLNTALGGGGSKKPAAEKPAAASENLQPTPTRDDVLAAMKGVTPAVQACGGGEGGVAMSKVSVTGSTGKVASVEVGGSFANSPVGTCVAKEVRKAKFPRFSQPTFSFSYPFKL